MPVNSKLVRACLSSATTVVWDFDGVIKESVEAKTQAFADIFGTFGKEIASRVAEHHKVHTGVSRFEKIPVYLQWAGVVPTPEKIDTYARLFGETVRNAVINAPWVPGAREYLTAFHTAKNFFLVTATPQQEIEEILRVLGIQNCFERCYGSPTSKQEALRQIVSIEATPLSSVVYIGDSNADFEAAHALNMTFVLRRTTLNASLQDRCEGRVFDNFLEI
jgi:phosphoglycolate phosphatase-like HAD superfamily hydrolase